MAGIVFIGWMIGFAGEEIFDFPELGGVFLWPLMLVVLLIYEIYTLIKAVVRKLKVQK
jgi:hypothetical protein